MLRLKELPEAFRSVTREVKAFLHRQRWEEALTFSFFIVLSFGFWLLRCLQEEYETDLSIPVKYTNVPANIAFESERPTEIKVHVRDKGSALLQYAFWNRAENSITINLGQLAIDGGEYTVGQPFLQNEIQKLLHPTTNFFRFYPQRITINYGLRKKKEVPVVFDGDVETPKGYLVSGDITTTPSMVTIYGSQSMLDTIDCVHTSYQKLSGVNKTISRDVALKPIEGVNMETKSVSVIIPVEEYTEKTIELPLSIKDVPDIYTIRIFPQTVSVSCNIPVSKFQELTQEELVVDLSFQMLEENVSGTLDVDLTTKPEWVRSYYITPKKIEFLLEVNGEQQP